MVDITFRFSMQRGIGIILILFLLASLTTPQQATGQQAKSGSLPAYQDTLADLGNKIMKSAFSPERIEANYQFIQTLVEALQQPGSYNFPFDSVENMRILYAPDNSFRIMSWYVDRGNSSYRFYGAVQMNAPELELFGLVDHSNEFAHPEDTVSSYKRWYGAYYYDIIPAGSGEKEYYVLLGWKGLSDKVSGRVIEALHFQGGEPVFGMPVFQTEEGSKSRVVFKYSARASMMLNYLPPKKTIVFDHLVPAAEQYRGNHEFYGPDLSYDGLKLVKGLWQPVENLELENEKSISDKLFNDPEKMQNEPASKLPEDN